MFDHWKFERGLNRIRNAEKKNWDGYLAAREKVGGSKNQREIDAVEADFSIENMVLRDDKEKLITGYLLNEAAKYLVPVPDRTDSKMWEGTKGDRSFVLSPLGVQELRNAIHEEIKKTWERRFIWVQPLSALLSLLIALGGLAVAAISLWLKKP